MSAAPENPPDHPTSAAGERDLTGWTQSAFFRTHSPRLEALIRRRISSRFQARFDAADVVQSAFRSFFFRLSSDKTRQVIEPELWPLLVEIAVRKLSQQIRRHSAQRRSVATDVADGSEVASSAAGPDESASLSEIIGLVRQSLDNRSSIAFSLRLEGYEILEIAGRMEISERTVRRYLATARQVLQRLLDLEPSIPNSDHPVTSAQPLPTALRFDDYLLHQWIGDGAVGNVYRATEKSTGRTVAVKFVKKAFRFHPQAIASFRREVQIVAQLDHPGIVRITGLGKTPNHGDFLVMDWAPGGDLARHTAAKQPPLTDIRRWGIELVDALHHAHQHGVIHCDLKPSNVLVGPTGRLQLSDFGLARQFVGWSVNTTATGGTPAFIAPELVEPSWGPIGPWTDVFGVGAIVFNLLTGRPLYEGRSLESILAKIVDTSPIVWPHTSSYSIPQEWRAGCNELLAKRVSSRVQDMIGVRQILGSLPC